MKKKDVIAAVAFDGIPPSWQMEEEQDLGDGVTMYPMTMVNATLSQSSMIQQILEDALTDVHDDTELSPKHFDTLRSSLESFRDRVLEAIILPECIEGTKQEFAEKLASLASLRKKN